MAEETQLDPVIDATACTSRAVERVGQPLWQLELAGHSAMHFQQIAGGRTVTGNTLAQIAASMIALVTLVTLVLRHGGTSPTKARLVLAQGETVFATHGEDSTRTRHLRDALARYDAHAKPILIPGRPTAALGEAAHRFDPVGSIAGAHYIRPLSLATTLASLPRAVALLASGIGETSRYAAPLGFRDRLAIAFRMALGAAHARWWCNATGGLQIRHALFAHTGTGDLSQLEQAMQHTGTRTVHLVHGTNIGWAFAGLSDVAVFPSGADARLGARLPAYGTCTHLPLKRPEVSPGNGDWALLTSYTHLQHPAFATTGSQPDCELVRWVSRAADRLGQDPARIFWRPHPQIELVPAAERERLEATVAQAGFTRWPDTLPYAALGEFSAAVTTPSTVLTDGLRLGQPMIVASLTPLQHDLLYADHPLLVEDEARLHDAIVRVLDPKRRAQAFSGAWAAMEPGDHLQLTDCFAL
ncbi:MAG: hypothetical protein H6920_03020 [Sphingomonadaceae bacterium]|nr:hypothetical protein [Sphingomonadaceae bacterium]MCP5390584.1 hypothetical protein [Sphingomonadaceae bacterium]MCP5392779.1 hypothetical protein [Sphingomonadaceae bacterium]